MKIIYTDSAKSELSKFQDNRKRDLEEFLKNNKYIFGDETLEITASDIRDADKYFLILNNKKNRSPFTELLLNFYLGVGIGMVMIGIFYQYFYEIVINNPLQLALILGGIFIIVITIVTSKYIKYKQRIREDMTLRYMQVEKIMSSETKNKDEY
ncbi:MAG: hypothetical protein WEB02_01810 [Methylophaga sp.]